MSQVFGIDIGTSAIRIIKKGTGLVYNQKNCVALFEQKKVIAIGDEAFSMYEKTPSEIEVSFPVKNGVLADIKNMLSILDRIFEKIGEEHGKVTGGEFLVAVPCFATDVERKALVDIVADSGAEPKIIKIVDRPVADVLGAGINLKQALTAMVVDIGARTTDISVVSIGGVVESRTLMAGGNTLDESIISAIRLDYRFIIGKKSAENVRIKLGTAKEPSPEETVSMKVLGRDVVSGLPGSITIDSYFIYMVIKEFFESLFENVKSLQRHISAEMSYDILESGICLTGGLSATKRLDEALQECTGLKVVKPKDDGTLCIVNGLKKIAEDTEYNYLADKYSALTIKV